MYALSARAVGPMGKVFAADIEPKDEKVLHAVLLILLAPVGQYMIQQKLNELWGKVGA